MTEYLIPDTIEEAIHLLAAHAGQARIIAGGTDVLPDLRKGKLAPACLVDVTRIPELTRITIDSKAGQESEAEESNEAEHPERRAIARSRRMRSGLPDEAASFDSMPRAAAGSRSVFHVGRDATTDENGRTPQLAAGLRAGASPDVRILRTASHVAGDTSRDENWNADDADTADNADKLRFHPRPPRRLRSPRPIFGLVFHAAGGATAHENVGRVANPPYNPAISRAGCSAYVTVGAAVTFAMLREHPYLQAHVHALVEAAASVGAAPIQSAATWGGNLVQAMPAADGAISAIALDAELHVVDAAAGRWLPVVSSFLGPGRSAIDPTRQLITAIRFPIPATPWGTAWRRAGRRPSLILPTLNCAVKLVLDENGERIAEAAIALGPVAACPHRAVEAETFLVGRAPGPEVFAEAARLARLSADPRTSIHRASREYRLAILPVLVAEALGVAAERAHDTA